MTRGRKPISEELKKQKLTLSCSKQTITYLNMYCEKHGMSISQLVDDMAAQMQAEEEKAAAKAARIAKKADTPMSNQLKMDM